MRVRGIWWNVQRFFSLANSALAHELQSSRRDGWTKKVYTAKLDAVAAVLRAICPDDPPALLGLCEVENRSVVDDLIARVGWPSLIDPSISEGGLEGYDVTLLYDERVFSLREPPRSYNVHNRFAVRDVFTVALETKSGAPFDVLANHWPSRQWPASAALRVGLGDYCSRLVDRIVKFEPAEIYETGRPRLPKRERLLERWNRPVLLMGDFNDEPFDESVSQMLSAMRDRSGVLAHKQLPRSGSNNSVQRYLKLRPRLYNPSWLLLAEDERPSGTLRWQGRWYLLDQIMMTRGMLTGAPPRFVDGSLRVFSERRVDGLDDGDPVELLMRSGRPRAFNAQTLDGVSDHLPLIFELEV